MSDFDKVLVNTGEHFRLVQRAEAAEAERDTLLAALRDAAEELHFIDENMAWEDVHRVASRLAAISEVEGEK